MNKSTHFMLSLVLVVSSFFGLNAHSLEPQKTEQFQLPISEIWNFRASPFDPPYYLVLTLQKEPLDLNKPTRVIVAGEGHEGGEGAVFQETAVSQALRYQEAFPSDQILLFFAIQGSLAQEMSLIQDWNLKVLAQGLNKLGYEELISQLGNLKKISALHIYSHAWKDFAAIQGWDTLSTFSDVDVLKERLTNDAYVVIHGCNAGWELAPYLAQNLNVPVAGALTSTNFERLHSSGNFYFNDNVTKPQGPWAVKNPYSYLKSRPCYQGACMRMKSDNHPYKGLHGELPQGLPFYKFYCPAESSQESCELVMAKSLMGFVDLKPLTLAASEEDFKTVARDWLCPISNVTHVRNQCLQALQAAEKSQDPQLEAYSPYQGPLVRCDAYSCWESSLDEKPDSFVREYRAFLRGIHGLKSVNFF